MPKYAKNRGGAQIKVSKRKLHNQKF